MAVKPDDPHFARTRLLALENTFGGQVMPQSYIAAATGLARNMGLATHLDGARLFNAAIAQDIDPRDITQHFDSVSVCLSKGLGAPAGSVLLGSAVLIDKALRLRKMLGGGMRQAGVLAAAATYALDHHMPALAEDHRRAMRIGHALQAVPGIMVRVATNMVWVSPIDDGSALNRLACYLTEQGVLLLNRRPMRLVTHLDIKEEDLIYFCELIDKFDDLNQAPRS